jgi:uncharacterized protein (UPF0262 family)
MGDSPDREAARGRLVRITLEEGLRRGASADTEHERDVAIYDLIESNRFDLVGAEGRGVHLHLAIVDRRLVFDVSDADGGKLSVIGLSLSPFRRIVRDYFLVCESYYQAIRNAPPSRIEAIDMGRRGLHDEGSRLLQERLAGKAVVDFSTARRLFTLICALHWRG